MKREIDYQNIILDRAAAEPLHIQLKQALIQEIRSAAPDQQLIMMSERELAVLLDVSRPTTHRAYQELLAAGLVHRRPDKSLEVNAGARCKIAGSYRIIGVLLPMDFSSFMDNNKGTAVPYLKGLISRASRQNTSCMMLQVPGADADDAAVDAFLEEHIHRLCGLVHLGAMLHPGSRGRILRRIMERQEIPQICISGHCDYSHIGSVNCDPSSAMEEACKDMVAKGVSTLGIIRSSNIFPDSPFIYSASSRDALMEEIAVRSGIKVINVISSGDENALHQLVSPPHCPDAVYCHNDRIAAKVMEISRAVSGKVKSLFYAYDRNFTHPGLAQIDPHPEKIAAKAVDVLIEYFEKGITAANRDVRLPAVFIPAQEANLNKTLIK